MINPKTTERLIAYVPKGTKAKLKKKHKKPVSEIVADILTNYLK